jgi:rhamnosyltransferase
MQRTSNLETANQNRQLAAILVAYQPSPDFVTHVLALASQFDRVWVLDNDDLSTYEGYERLGCSNVTHVRNGENIGLAAAQNAGVELAHGAGFNWVVLLDQDSELPAAFSATANEAINKFDADQQVAMFAPQYVDHGVRYKRSRCDYRAIQFAIASGSLVRTSSYRLVGGMDSQLFIDYVDYDFCFKLTLRHFRLLGLPATIYHSVGNLTKHRLIFWPIVTSNHPPRRLFSAARNLVVLSKRYWRHRPVLLALFWCLEFRRQLFIGLFESDAGDKVLAFLRGVKEGVLYGDSRDLRQSIYYGAKV